MTSELERQQALLDALWRRQAEGALPLRTRGAHAEAGIGRGMTAYRTNAGAAAERALASSFPVLRALVGEDTFAALARAYWQAVPPERGDLAWLGAALADFVASDPRLADVPWLADVARLEWLVARAETAADAPGSAGERLASLHVLADFAPQHLFIELAPGGAVLRSAWPVASVWHAHRADAAAIAQAQAQARERIATRTGEAAFVWRPEWAARVVIVDDACACMLGALGEGRDLAGAIDAATRASADWSFEAWLARAIEGGWLGAARAARSG